MQSSEPVEPQGESAFTCGLCFSLPPGLSHTLSDPTDALQEAPMLVRTVSLLSFPSIEE